MLAADLGRDGAQGGDGAGGVGLLVAAGQARQRQIEQAALVLIDETAVLLANMEILAGDRRAARRARRASRSSTARAASC